MKFKYTAIDNNGKAQDGEVEALDQPEANRKIKELGLYATSITALGKVECNIRNEVRNSQNSDIDKSLERMMDNKTDKELDTMGETIDKMTVATIRMVDDVIEFETNPTDAAFNVYFSKYVDSLVDLRRQCRPVFEMMYNGLSGMERDIATEVLAGDIGRAKTMMRDYMTKKRKEGAVLAREGETYLDKIKQAREEVYAMAKDRNMDLGDLK